MALAVRSFILRSGGSARSVGPVRESGKICIIRISSRTAIAALAVYVFRNLIFVNASQQRITELKMYNKDCQPLRYMTNPFSHDDTDYLLTVPDHQMENFIRVASVKDDRLLYLDPNVEYLNKPGKKVRITDGDFKDAEGVIKRIKNNKRVVVEIQGVAAVAITYVPSVWLEPID